MGSEASALADHAVGITHGVGRELLGVVVVVGRATAGRLAGVGLDELAFEVGAHELAIDTDPDGLVQVLVRD